MLFRQGFHVGSVHPAVMHEAVECHALGGYIPVQRPPFETPGNIHARKHFLGLDEHRQELGEAGRIQKQVHSGPCRKIFVDILIVHTSLLPLRLLFELFQRILHIQLGTGKQDHAFFHGVIQGLATGVQTVNPVIIVFAHLLPGALKHAFQKGNDFISRQNIAIVHHPQEHRLAFALQTNGQDTGSRSRKVAGNQGVHSFVHEVFAEIPDIRSESRTDFFR